MHTCMNGLTLWICTDAEDKEMWDEIYAPKLPAIKAIHNMNPDAMPFWLLGEYFKAYAKVSGNIKAAPLPKIMPAIKIRILIG